MNHLLKRIATPTLALGAALLMFACETTENTTQPATMASGVSMGVVNSTCPMTGEKVDASGKLATWNGKKVAFCCNGCVGAWNKKSDSDKTDFVASAEN